MSGRSAQRGIIFDIRRYSVQDGPGIRTTVFFKGCPLRCVWCHNPESQEFKPVRIRRKLRLGSDDFAAEEWCGREVTVPQVLSEAERDWPFYEESGGGITFSGGEPFAQPEFLATLLDECRRRGWHTCVDTCGHAEGEWVRKLAPGIDLFLYDLKLIDPELHRRFTGAENDRILENLAILAGGGHSLVIRFPLIPGYTDSPANLEGVARFVARLPGRPAIHLLPYHRIFEDKCRRFARENRLGDTEPPQPEAIQAAANHFIRYGLTVQIGG